MTKKLTQETLDTECKHAKIYALDYLRIDGPLIGCHHETAGQKDGWCQLKLCIASHITGPQFEYSNLDASNYLKDMDLCEYKIPLTPNELRFKERLIARDKIYDAATKMQKQISEKGIDNTIFKTNTELEDVISLVMLNYLKSNDYESKNFNEKLSMREKAVHSIERMLEKIKDTIEARL